MGYKIDGKPDQKSATFRTKAEAERADAKMLAERDAMRGRSGRITLESFIDNYYWPSASRRLAATSKDTYEKEIRLRIKPMLGKMDVRDIDRLAIQAMIDTVGTESVARKCAGVLKTVLNVAKGDGLILYNPADSRFAMPAKGKSRSNKTDILTTFEDIYAFLDAIDARATECMQKIVYTGMLAGLRPEERYALDWSDIDIEDKVILVQGAYVSASAKYGGLQQKETKTAYSYRAVPMHARFYAWACALERESGAFIKGRDGKRISPSSAQKKWSRFLSSNPDMPKVTIENMRHSFATSYLHAGGNIEDLSRILGHADINTTYRRYVKPDILDLRRGMESVS